MNDDEFYDILYQFADTVIEIEEVDPENGYLNEVVEASKKYTEKFFKQIDEQLSLCKEENEIVFVKEVALNFLIFSLKKIIVDYDCPDENIEYLAEHIKKQIISVKRSEYEKKHHE